MRGPDRMKREFVCIVCPKSCELSAEEFAGVLNVSGNQCERGIAFAVEEVYNPQRVLTTTVRLTTGGLLPVRSKGSVKQGELKALVERLKSVEATPPIVIGQIIADLSNGERIEIVATDTVKRQ